MCYVRICATKARDTEMSFDTTALEQHSPIPLYLQIEQRIGRAIHVGDLAPMSKVSSELELASTFGVSRMTARKAVDRLVAEGLLFRRQGKGTFVAQPKIAHGLSTQLSFGRAMSALGLRLSTSVLQQAMAPAPDEVADALQIMPGASTVYIRRLRIVEGEPAAIHISYLPGGYGAILDVDLSGSLTNAMAAVGARVEHSRDTVEAVLASPGEANELSIGTGSPLLLIEGVAFSAGSPVRYTKALYRGDRFKFSVDTSLPADLRVEVKS